MQNLLDELTNLLANDKRLVVDGKLLKNKVVELTLQLDPRLLKLLLSNSRIKNIFFQQVDGVYIFDKIKFQKFINNKSFLPNSFTSFKNKIGLIEGDDFINENTEVVLAWPYKDCLLEGNQSKDSQRKNEIFWNETLASEEIDRLLDPKIFRAFKKFDTNGESEVTDISLQDNFIIKGNNLVALYSLKKVYTEKIKLVFIDPPYNTHNDSFRYNDSFSHSTWLTFMKNRLEVAKDLLRKDGLFWISISDKEAHYCKVLADEVFGRDNFVADVIWNSTKSVTNTAVISDAHTHILLYAKDINSLKANRTSFRLTADASIFSNPDNDNRGKWVADPFQVEGERPNQLYTITNPNTGVEYRPNPGNSWKNEKKVFDQLLKDNRIVFGTTGEAGPQRKRFWFEAKERGKVTTTLWKDLPTTTNGTKHLKSLFGEKVFDNPKPEGLMERIIQLSTEENDIVLDYHLGSGTTATAAHKMKRRYIGIEQMDYIHEVTVMRLQKVIEGENGGISSSQDWKGGGSFIYFELHDIIESFIDDLSICKTKPEVIDLVIKNLDKNIFKYNLTQDLKKVLKSEAKNHSLQEFKTYILSIIDFNQAYHSYSEIDDSDYKVSEKDKILTAKFYSLNEQEVKTHRKS